DDHRPLSADPKSTLRWLVHDDVRLLRADRRSDEHLVHLGPDANHVYHQGPTGRAAAVNEVSRAVDCLLAEHAPILSATGASRPGRRLARRAMDAQPRVPGPGRHDPGSCSDQSLAPGLT